MKSVLSDHIRFKLNKCTKDLTDSTEKRIAKLLIVLLKKIIDNSTCDSLRPRGSRMPHIYGLSEINKQGTPFRRILSIFNLP